MNCNIIEKTRTENTICALWRSGKSCKQIEDILDIRFTFKNQATNKTIPIGDISRTMQNGLMGWESLRKDFTDTL